MNVRPFPWGNTDGLVPVLDDPAVWERTFLDRETRQVIKRTSRKLHGSSCPPHWGAVEVDDDRIIGEMTLFLMTTRAGRDRFRAMFGKKYPNRSWHEAVANGLYSGLCVDPDSDSEVSAGLLPLRAEVAESRGLKSYLVPQKFRAWLDSRDVSSENARILALYGCAFAILQADKAPEILQILAEKDPRLLELLDAPIDPSPEAPDSPDPEQSALSRMGTATSEATTPVGRQTDPTGPGGRLTSFRTEAGELATQVMAFGAHLAEDPPLSVAALVGSLDGYARSIEQLIAGMEEDLGRDCPEVAAKVRDAGSLGALEALVADVLCCRETARTAQAAEKLEIVRDTLIPLTQMRWKGDGSQPTELDDLRREAIRLLAIAQDPASLDSAAIVGIVEGTHRLALLRKGITEIRSLPGEQWMELNRHLSVELGGLVTMAVVRGWIGIEGTDGPVVESSSVRDVYEPLTGSEHQAGERQATDPPSFPETKETAGTDTRPPRALQAVPDGAGSAQLEATGESAEGLGSLSDSGIGILPERETAESHARHEASPTGCPESPVCPSSLWAERIATLIINNRVDLAYQLVRDLEALGATDGYLPDGLAVPSELLRSLVLSQVVQASYDEAAILLEDAHPVLFDRMHRAAPPDALRGIHLMILASTLRPSLLLPSRKSGELLRQVLVPTGLGRVAETVEAIRCLLDNGLIFSPEYLKGVEQTGNWQERLDEVTREIDGWLHQQRLSTILYSAATQVWHNLLEQGVLAESLAAAARADVTRVDGLRAFLDNYGGETDAARAILTADRSLRGQRAERTPIEARARMSLLKRYDQAVRYLSSWLEVIDQKPRKHDEFVSREVQRSFERISRVLDPAIEEISTATALISRCSYEAAGLVSLQRCLNSVKQLFNPALSAASQTPSVSHILGWGLLAIPEIELDASWHPVECWEADLPTAISNLPTEVPDWADVLNLHLRSDNFHAAQLVLELVDAGRAQLADVNAADRTRSGLETSRTALAELRDDLRSSVERSVLDGVLDLSEMQSWTAKLLEIDLESETRLGKVRRGFVAIRTDLESRRLQKICDLREQLGKMTLQEGNPKAFKLVQDRLEEGDITAAQEYLYLAEQGESLFGTDEEPGSFLPFHVTLAEFEKLKRSAPPIDPRAIEVVRDRRSYGPFTYKHVPPAQAKELGLGLDSWLAVRTGAQTVNEHVRTILQTAGFEVRSVTNDAGLRSGETYRWLKLECDPIRDRTICPLPAFGSQANGAYTILCIWGRPLEGDILEHIQRAHMSGALFCLFLGPMSSRRRRDLAHAARRTRLSLLLLDEHLYLYILQWGSRRERLAAFFRTSANYTISAPYTTTSSYVAPEMFYGRSEEQKQIAGLNNYHLIYGGRQLGKTALLRQVAANYHQPDRGTIVLWLDLKHRYGIGSQRPIDEIWSVIGDALRPYGIVQHTAVVADTVCRNIQGWLDGDSGRRVVLLLDEGDDFLASDSSGVAFVDREHRRAPWTHMQRLKNLAETTGGRFKFVFSGLHNVQRTGCDPNSPVAHLGPSICIGPFLKGELREAFRMVKDPLAALGYQFASDSLIMRVLAYGNYYPSLIQLICKQLVEYLTSDAVVFDEQTSPPYIIEERHVEGAYRSRELHREIVNRLYWTLELDNRYKVIALMVAYLVVDRDRGLLSAGIPVTVLRTEILANRSQAFGDDITLDAFRVLLDEMVGLGVLRDIGEDRFTLRSPNILGLLGGAYPILEQLMEALNQKPLPQYDAASFRRAAGTDEAWRRSPLTAIQERDLTDPASSGRVIILFGSEMSGIQYVPEFLRLAQNPGIDVIPLTEVADLETCRHDVETAWERGRKSLLVVVGRDCSWTARWVEFALDKVKIRGRSERKLRFVFMAPRDWTFARLKIHDFRDHTRRLLERVSAVSLRPWSESALRWWLDDVRVNPSTQMASEVLSVTGGWHHLITELGRNCHREPSRIKRHLADLDERLRVDDELRCCFEVPKSYHPVLQVFEGMGNGALTGDEIYELAGRSITPDLVAAALEWGDRMHYLRPEGNDQWRMDPVLARMLVPSHANDA